MTSVDIVTLVNNNPIKKFSKNYNSKIIDKLKEKFSDNEKQLFIANFYCYLNYNTRKDFVIRLDDIWTWLGYSRIDVPKGILINNFKEGEDYVIEKIPNSQHGGQNKENVKLTVHCFKKLCLAAKTKKSSEIHEYYLTLEEVISDLLIDQSQEFAEELLIVKNKLQDKEEVIKSLKIDNLKVVANMDSFDLKHVFYVLVITCENGVVIEIKFGWSNNIKQRYEDHKKTYGKNCYFTYIVETHRNIKMENEVKRIFKDRIFERMYNGGVRTELMKFDDNFTLEMFQNELLNIRKNIESKEVLLQDIKELEEENDRLKKYYEEQLKTNKEVFIDNLTKFSNEKTIDNDLREREIKERQKTNEILGYKAQEILDNGPTKPNNNLPKYQIYDPKTLKLVKSFKNIYEIQKELGLEDNMRYDISRASKKNTILKKFRIFKLKSDKDETIEYKIPETYEINRKPHNEQVVCFNNEGTEIIGLFSNSNEASNFIKERDNLTNTVKQINKSITSNLGPSSKINNTAYGYRWFRIGEFIQEEEENESDDEESENDNEEQLKKPVKNEIKKRKFDSEEDKVPYLEIFNKYIKTHDIPKYIANKNQKIVYKYDIDEKIIITYNSVSEALRAGKFSDVTLHKNIKNKTLLKNGYWSYEKDFEIEKIKNKN